MEHGVGVPPEEKDDGAAVDDDAREHEDQDEDVGRRPVEGQTVHHHLHPRFRVHLWREVSSFRKRG